MAANSNIATVAQVAEVMDAWAPPWTAESWDRVGLLVGDPAAPAARVGVALELTPKVLATALEQDLQMLLLHHPPLFKPLNNLRSDEPATARLLKAASGGLSLFAAHTNLDSAPHGVNDALAARLGLVNTRPLIPAAQEGLAKLVVFVPESHVDQVSSAVFQAGAGTIGNYSDCAFQAPGLGSFSVPPQGKPFVGEAGEATQAEELRWETVMPRSQQSAVIRALRQAHPYEEPAFDIYPLANPLAGFGLGRVGELKEPMPGQEFLAKAAGELKAPAAQSAGPVPDQVERVAVIGGSGGDYLRAVAGSGVQVLITGEARHHSGQEAEDLGICLAVLGHFATEEVVVEPWTERLARLLESKGLTCEVKPIRGVDPWRRCET